MELSKAKLVLPVIRGVLGDWVYYSSMMTAKQVSEWIKPAKDIREAQKLDEILQRDLDGRAPKISTYLRSRENHFFNSIIVGVFGGVPDWVPFELKDKSRDMGAENPELFEDAAGILVFNGSEDMFAIDGQHRVAGISKSILDDSSSLPYDQFPVIFIAHVDNQEGRRRTRRLFSDINKNAKPVALGDRVLIDEDDECAVVARKLYAEYPLFNNGAIISLTKTAKLDVDDNFHFTNLLALHTVVKTLKRVTKKKKGDSWLSDNSLKALFDAAVDVMDYLVENVVDYNKYFISKTLSLEAARRDNSNLLFRPIGLFLLCKVYCYLKKHSKLRKFKTSVSKISFLCPDSPFNKILWNNGKLEAVTKNQQLAFNLTLYLIGEDVEEASLLETYRQLVKDEEAVLPPKVARRSTRRSKTK